MLELLERQTSLTINQWKIFLACFFSLALDFFDFFLISFVLAFFVRDWNLTYGQSALILLSSGVASVPAGYFFGWLGDRIGRRNEISLPASLPAPRQTSWSELFKYPRSIAASCLTGLSQTGGVGLALWQVTLLVLVLKVTPAHASYLTIWVSLIAIFGRFFCAWLSDALGRRPAGILICLVAALTMSLAGYLHDVTLGAMSMFYLMILVNGFFGPGTYAIIGPYMTEVWPAPLRASGLGLAYGTSNLGKFIGPAGLALIAGASNFVTPQATLDAIIPAFNYFAGWYVLAALAFLFIAIETRGRTIEELDAALTGRVLAPATVKIPAQ